MMQADWPHVAEALAAAAREINAPKDLEATLQSVVDGAARALPGFDHVGITIGHRVEAMETKAATDQLVRDLDALQYDLGEGPCVHAITRGEVVSLTDARHDARWPRFLDPATRLGLRSQLGLRLFVNDETLGGLNLYSTTSGTIEPEVVHLADLFATHAALALSRAVRENHLLTALDSRQRIGQAVGIIMERHGLDESRAFEYLTRLSSHGNVKLRNVAEEIIDARRAPREPG
jgi:GAF domain-containing protein